MNYYKLIILFKNNKIDLKKFISTFKNFLFLNCFLMIYENWGLINLSYKIKNELKCFYLYFFLKITNHSLSIFYKFFKEKKYIIRFIFIKNKKKIDNISFFIKKKLKKKWSTLKK